MSLWADKYRPQSLDKLTYHNDLSAHLKKMAHSGDFPHMLFYGPPGAGKKTRIAAVLREIYGPGVERLKVDQRQFVTPSNRKLDLNIVSSNYHMELNPSDVGMYDRAVVQDLIKEVAQTQQIDANAKHRFKIIVINEADELSREAQAGLRRTMEKYMTNLRIILCCNSTSKIISPIRSRCLLVRVARPSEGEIDDAMQAVAKKENFSLPHELSVKIADESDRNLRKALLTLEATKVQEPNLAQVQKIVKTDWEIEISNIADLIIAEQNPNRVLLVRTRMYELISRCIPSSLIIKNLAFDLANKVDRRLRSGIIEHAAIYEHRLRTGNKDIFHLEAFVARVMSLIKRHQMEKSS
ncbi:P-loop containing nucleoside triphosphate hydrolase protein [Umbelopsis sp. AD052]|nr:P-loop containing nucleoside triphosphate hydrolase protein [Umbelopsis sp. AD052]